MAADFFNKIEVPIFLINMSYIISSEKLILTFFASNCRKKVITVNALNKLACDVSNACNHGVIVTVNKSAIEYAAIKQHSIITFVDGKVRLICPHAYVKRQIRFLNSDMPQMIKEHLETQCINYGQKL